MSTLYLLTGPAGVGKSTISFKLAKSLEKSVLIEGDDIYHQVISSYQSPWKDGNHLEIFWKVCVNSIQSYLENDYDVVFNYIINSKEMVELANIFEDYYIKFVVLMTDEKILVDRDNSRTLGSRMGQRVLTLLEQFKKDNYPTEYVLDTSSLTIDETVDKILSNENYFL